MKWYLYHIPTYITLLFLSNVCLAQKTYDSRIAWTNGYSVSFVLPRNLKVIVSTMDWKDKVAEMTVTGTDRIGKRNLPFKLVIGMHKWGYDQSYIVFCDPSKMKKYRRYGFIYQAHFITTSGEKGMFAHYDQKLDKSFLENWDNTRANGSDYPDIWYFCTDQDKSGNLVFGADVMESKGNLRTHKDIAVQIFRSIRFQKVKVKNQKRR